MPLGVFADKLLDISSREAGDIAEQWFKAVSASPRTPAFHSLPKDMLVRQASTLYKNLKAMYFAERPYDEVVHFLESIRFTEDLFSKGVPLAELVYALILMRRNIWLHAETQVIFYNTAYDIHQQTESINRTVLIFDYIIFLVVEKYEEISVRRGK